MTTSKEVEMGCDHQPTTEAPRQEDGEGVVLRGKAEQHQASKREIRCKWVLCAGATALVLATVSVIMYLGITNEGPQTEVTTKPPNGGK